jgi:hypothetical protein
LDEILLAEAREEPVVPEELSLEALLLAENEAALALQTDQKEEVGSIQPLPNLSENVVDSHVLSPGVFTPHELQFTLDLEHCENTKLLWNNFIPLMPIPWPEVNFWIRPNFWLLI